MEDNKCLSNNQYGSTTTIYAITVVTSFIHQTYDSKRHGAGRTYVRTDGSRCEV